MEKIAVSLNKISSNLYFMGEMIEIGLEGGMGVRWYW